MKHQYEAHLREVFQVLTDAQLHVKWEKCEFFRTRISFLGHEVAHQQLFVQEDKQAALARWQPPLTNAQQVRQFVGLASYYSSFIP